MSSKTKSSTVRLVIENKEMEDRLKSLKKIMAMEKIQRSNENVQGKKYWKSSQSGEPLHTSTSAQDGSFKKRKVKILTGNEQYNTKDRVSCGQCDQYKASIACVECIENYCTVCFTKFHQKGALSNHRVRPLDAKAVSQVIEYSPVKQFKTCSTSTGTGTGTDIGTGTGTGISTGTGTNGVHNQKATSGISPHSQVYTNTDKSSSSSLLDGIYDEEASSKSFQDALLAWRNSKNTTESSSTAVSTSSCGIQTAPASVPSSRPTPDIHFTPSSSCRLSYMERLVLQKKRSNPSFSKIESSLNKVKGHESLDDHTEEDEDQYCITTKGVPSEHNLFYSIDDTVSANVNKIYHDDQSVSLHVPSSSVVIQDVKESLVEDHSSNNNDDIDDGVSHVVIGDDGVGNDSLQSQKSDKKRQPSATRRRKESKPKKKTPKKPHTDNNSSNVITPSRSAQSTYKGLGGFFLVDSADDPLHEDNSDITPNEQSTDNNGVSVVSLQAVWLPSSSIPDEDHNINNTGILSSEDLPPHCIYSLANTDNNNYESDTDDSNDDTMVDDGDMMSNDEQGDEDRVLEDLGRELIVISRTEEHREGQEEITEEDMRALSRMTIEQLVEDFEEYQSQVMSNED